MQRRGPSEVPANLSEPLDEDRGRGVVGHEQGTTALGRLLVQADEIQAAVRQRIEPHTWEAFWLVGVLFGQSKRRPSISR